MITLRLKDYDSQESEWPKKGRHILAQYDDDTIVVYQAFKPEIAEWAIKNQKFGGLCYNFNRMSWIKTNFLWMMFRSGWASKKDQEQILAISVNINWFMNILGKAHIGASQKDAGLECVDVRLQWDPDHGPQGQKVERRAIQIGLRGEALESFNKNIRKIEDITSMVTEQRKHAESGTFDNLSIPEEHILHINDDAISKHIGLSTL